MLQPVSCCSVTI